MPNNASEELREQVTAYIELQNREYKDRNVKRAWNEIPHVIVVVYEAALYGEELPGTANTLVHIIDCSCSMDSQWQTYIDESGEEVEGYRMDRAKSEIVPSIHRLPPDRWFDVVSTDLELRLLQRD